MVFAPLSRECQRELTTDIAAVRPWWTKPETSVHGDLVKRRPSPSRSVRATCVASGLWCALLLTGCEFSDTTWSDGVVSAYNEWLPVRQSVNRDCSPTPEAPKDVQACVSALKRLEAENAELRDAVMLPGHRALDLPMRKECAADLTQKSKQSAKLRKALVIADSTGSQLAAAKMDAADICVYVTAFADNDSQGALSIYRRLAGSSIVWWYLGVAAVLFVATWAHDKWGPVELTPSDPDSRNDQRAGELAASGSAGKSRPSRAQQSGKASRPRTTRSADSSQPVPHIQKRVFVRTVWTGVVSASATVERRFVRMHTWIQFVAALVLAAPLAWLGRALVGLLR